MTEVILSQWVIAAALGALCLAFLLFCFVPAIVVGRRLRGVKDAINAVRADSAQMKESLVGDLRDILDGVAERQIEAGAEHQAQLGQNLASVLQSPLEGVAQSLQEFGKSQNAEISQGLQEQMSLFADKLDGLLGGQVGHARDLQQQTLKSLESTMGALQQMTKTIAATAEGASQSMINQLRAGISRSQAETDAHLKALIGKLGNQVSGAVTAIEQQASLSGRMALEHQKKLADEANHSLETLSDEIHSQTQAVELASQSMRTAGADVATAVDRIIEGMTGLISGAAQEFTRSGQNFAEMFERSSTLSHDMSETAAALAASSRDIGTVVTDYSNARETLQSMIDLMRSTVETARNDSSLASDFVARIETAAQKLTAAQGQADESLAKLNGVLSEAHNAFGGEMLETVRSFQEHLSRTLPAQQLSDESQRRHSEFDRMISDWVQATPRLRQSGPGADRDSGEERMPARVAMPGNGAK